MRFYEWLGNSLVFRPDLSQFSFVSGFSSAHRPDLGRGTLTFDEFCRVAVHFSDEDDEALQLSTRARADE